MAVSLGMVIALIKKFGGGGGGGGGVTDVRVNGTSVVSGGKADIPVISNDDFGVAKTTSNMGIKVDANGKLYVDGAGAGHAKTGTEIYKPITPSIQHTSVFYALAKLVGADMKNSNNAVGTYTEDAKSGIAQMLDAPETISGTTPSITGKAGIRYECGEVATLSITPPASGDMEVIFSSGSTPTVLTVPSTVKFPAWFDPTDLEADVTYDLIITNGVYGVITSWA